MTQAPLPPKKEVCLALLERDSVFLHLDPRGDDVFVPKWFKNKPQLVLQIGLNMPVPIPDLSIEDDAVTCTLSFSRSPFLCRVPWSAVYALVGEDGRGMVWPDDIPKEVAVQSAQKAQADKKPKLRAVENPAPARRDDKVTDLASRRSSRPPSRAEMPQSVAGAEEMDAPRRPMLAAVEDEREAAPEPTAPKPPPRAKQRAKGKGARKEKAKPAKRELPSYLRVIK